MATLQTIKFENVPVITKCLGDFKVIAFVSGNNKADVVRKMKQNSFCKNQGIVYLDCEAFEGKGFNSNKF